ncbi:MAG: hypothetical protein OEX23_09905 [Betaproteobacteria bacterium]|jgi:hypothetical protein|nr:hypothetical protein [Betaproteobacteria bacterium]
MRTLRALVFVAALAPLGALAQQCVGFGDVLASSPFCPNVEWVKNRGVTLGCGTGANYCPNDPVTRLQMAIFLNRLGTALTPVDLAPAVSGPVAGISPAGNPILCQTADFANAATSFPRRAVINGAAILSIPTANIDVSARIVYSTDAGTTWTAINNSDQYQILRTGLSPADHATLNPFGAVDINVNQSMRFGIRLGQFAGSGTITAACTTLVQIWNRNGASTPFDAQGLSTPPSRQPG